MDVRQYNLYIDGRKLPHWFLPHAFTQMGVRTFMRFDGLVDRFDLSDDEPAGPPYDPLPDRPFAQLDGHGLCFRLKPAEGGYVSVRLVTELADCHMSWQVQGEGNEILDFEHHVWMLESGVTYVIYLHHGGERTQMTLQARRCREPLQDLSRALLNR